MRVEFNSALDVEKLAGEYWRITRTFCARVKPDQGKPWPIRVPAGYVTDFASVPRLPLVFLAAGDTAHRSAVLHDWLYNQGERPRAECDRVFLAAMQAEGVPWWRRRMMYAAVRAAGGSHYGRARDAR